MNPGALLTSTLRSRRTGACRPRISIGTSIGRGIGTGIGARIRTGIRSGVRTVLIYEILPFSATLNY
jgi:hypothetical protein